MSAIINPLNHKHMKTIMKLMAVLVIMASAMTGCTEKKNGNESAATSEQTTSEAVEEKGTNLDFDHQRLSELMNKKAKEVTSDDYDFLIDQAEIMVKKVKGMSPEEVKQWQKNLSKEETGSIMIIGLGLGSAKKSDKLTDRQLKRLEQLEEQMPEELK